MLYKDFVREMFDKHRGKMPAKDIMKLAAKEWPSVRDGKMSKIGKMSKKGKSRGGALSMPGLGDINSGIAVASAALPVVSGIADALGSLFGSHTEVVPAVRKLQQGQGLKKMKKSRGGNVGGELYSDFDGKRNMVESATVNTPNMGGKLKKSRSRGGNVGGGYVGGGYVGGAMVPNKRMVNFVPKETNVMSQFFQYDTLPKSNYAPSRGGAFVMPGSGHVIDPAHGENPMGGGLMDTLGSLVPLAFMF